MSKFTDIGVENHDHVGLIEIRRPPMNFFDVALINQIADALEQFDSDIEIRCSVLAAQGKAFCAGANFNDPARQEQESRAQTRSRMRWSSSILISKSAARCLLPRARRSAPAPTSTIRRGRSRNRAHKPDRGCAGAVRF